MSQISDDCDPETNGGKGPSTSEANNARYSVPDDYDNNDDLKLQKSGFGNRESPTKEEGASNVTLPFENRRYSAKDIERKCKDKNIWCQEYMNCLRRIHKASDIFPELEDIGEITLPKETSEYIKKTCKRYNLNENACKDLERSARKGIAFKQLLGRLVEGTERRGRKNNTNSDNINLIFGGAIAFVLLLLFYLCVHFFWKDTKKSQKRHGGKRTHIKSGLKSGRSSGGNRFRSKPLSSMKNSRKSTSAVKSAKSLGGKTSGVSGIKSFKSKQRSRKQK